MSNLDLEEQEQLDELKAWWKQYGNLVMTAAAVVLAGFAAWNGWNWYRNTQSLEAAALYAFAEVRKRPVLCFAHVTNQMGADAINAYKTAFTRPKIGRAHV